MRNPVAELKALQVSWPDAELLEEGERTFALLPTFNVNVSGGKKNISALLRPWNNGDGYTTRLFFSEKFTDKGSNWNVFSIVGRSWHACSWNNVPDDISWGEMISNHLAPLQ